jgi:hypothetical protein
MLVLFVLLLNLNIALAIEGYEPPRRAAAPAAPVKLCSPLLPTTQKRDALVRFHNDSSILVYWHVQKCGGSTMCRLMQEDATAHHHWNAARIGDSRANNCKGPFKNLLKVEDGLANVRRMQDKGRQFMALEPADYFKKEWPSKYHEEYGAKYHMLHYSSDAAEGDLSVLWTAVPHVLTVREPTSRAGSALTYKFFGWGQSLQEACAALGLDAGASKQTSRAQSRDSGAYHFSLIRNPGSARCIYYRVLISDASPPLSLTPLFLSVLRPHS